MKNKLNITFGIISLHAIYSLFFNHSISSNRLIWVLNSFFGPFHFDYSIRGFFSQDQLNKFFSILLTLAVCTYFYSKQREARLLRFLFSIILLSRLVTIFTFIVELIDRFIDPSKSTFTIDSSIYLTTNIAWVYISFLILRKLHQNKIIKIDPFTSKTDEISYVIPATSSQRIFHLFIDTFITLLIFYPLLEKLIQINFTFSLLKFFSNMFGDNLSLLIIICLIRFIYFVFYEVLFQSSPAKFLTGTRVLTENTELIHFKTSSIRTLSRFVPFDSFSFLFANTGWHDKWSKTLVAQEESDGISNSLYFLLIPISIVLLFLSEFIN